MSPIDGSERITRELTRIDQVKSDQWAKDSILTYLQDVFASIKDCFTMTAFRVTNPIQFFKLKKVNLLDFGICALARRIFGGTNPGFARYTDITDFLESKKFESFNASTYTDETKKKCTQEDKCVRYRSKNGNIDVLTAFVATKGQSQKMHFSSDEVFLPLNETITKTIIPIFIDNHIVTVVVDSEIKKIIYYDPQGFDIDKRDNLKTELLKLKDKLKEKENYDVYTLTMNGQVEHEQKNRTDCGLISICLIDHIIKGDPIETFNPSFEKDSVSRIKKRIEMNQQFTESTGGSITSQECDYPTDDEAK